MDTSSNQYPIFETASAETALRSVQFKVEGTAQRLFDSSYTSAALAYSDRQASNRDRVDPFSEQNRAGSESRERSAGAPAEVARGPVYAASASGDNEPSAVSKYLTKYPKALPDRVRSDLDDTPRPPSPGPVNPQPDNPNPGPRPGPGPRPNPFRPRPRPDQPRPRPDQPNPNPVVPVRPLGPVDPGKIDDIDPPKPPPPAPVNPVQPDRPKPPSPCPSPG